MSTLAEGSLFRAPERKTSKAGKPYLSATMKTAEGNEAIFVRLLVFSESAQEEIASLGEGDSLSVTGRLQAEAFEKDGKLRVSFSIIVDRALALKKSKRASKPNPSRRAPSASPSYQHSSPDHFGDDVPF